MERTELKRWLKAIAPAAEHGDFVFLNDPQWSPSDRTLTEALGQQAIHLDGAHGWLCIPTGGTGGSVRFARHDEQTLQASVSGFCLHLEVEKVNAVGVLPSHHVSGLMARIRSAETGGEYRDWDWKRLVNGDYPSIPTQSGPWFISLVPTQLQRLLERSDGVDFLRRFETVLVGGGPTWSELTDAAASARIRVALSYGMTETAAMVAAQKPEMFFAGERDAGLPMPHAQIEIIDDATGENCPPDIAGRIRIRGNSVFHGYFPDFSERRLIDTEDLGVLTPKQTLRVIGRRDSVIITGGEKVWPIEVETALRATGAFKDVAVIGVPDARWGEVVVACYPATNAVSSLDATRRALDHALAPYKQPKHFLAMEAWPRNAQGKLNRAALVALARENLKR